METAINQLMEISTDEKMRELYRAREKARLDMISKLKYAENRGMEKGTGLHTNPPGLCFVSAICWSIF